MSNFIKRMVLTCVERIAEHNVSSIALQAIHRDTFLSLKNLCNGERDVVVCGAGPTLQKYIPIEGAIHIAVNRAFLYEKVKFDYIYAQDMDGIRMVQDELVEYMPQKCVKLLAIKDEANEKTIPESLAIRCNAKRFVVDNYIYRDGFRSRMALDLENRPLGGMPNVGMSVIQLALYMNPKRLYIVGCDMSGNHFATGNQSDAEITKQKKELDNMWKKDHERLIDKWKEIKRFADIFYPETEIISVNPIGLRGIFKDFDQ